MKKTIKIGKMTEARKVLNVMKSCLNEGTSTPWGVSDSSEKVAPGITFYSTPSHGGYKLSPTMNAKVPSKWRLSGRYDGWYEEDCGWAPLALTFPEAFPKIPKEKALKGIANWESWVSGR